MKRKKSTGFTLIELLAVIVILAIIALIATPIILGIVEEARKDSFMRSVELVVGTTDIDIFNKDFNDSYTYTITDGVVSNLEVGVKNTEGMNGKIKYDKNGNDTYAIYNGKYCVIKTSGMNKAEITDYVEGECVLGKATDVKYFTYEEISENEYEYEIVDKDACVEFFEYQGVPSEDATIICNNELYDWSWMGGATTPLTEYLAMEYPGWTSVLKEVGAIEEKVTLLFEGIEITGYSEEGPKDVVIPEEINGKEVVSIGTYAFSDKSLTSVVLPETLVKISHSAFSTNLFTDITIPKNIEIIGDYAFCYTNLNQTSIDNISEINEYAYCTVTDESCFTYEESDEDNNKIEITGYQCATTDIVIPNKINNKEVISIGNEAFAGYTYDDTEAYLNKGTIRPVNYELAVGYLDGIITSVAIPDSVTYIENAAFSINKISRLKLSSNLEQIMTDAFRINSIAFVFIPDSLINIGSDAFRDNYSSIIISDNNQLETVGDGAFYCVWNSQESMEYQIINDINQGAIRYCNTSE